MPWIVLTGLARIGIRYGHRRWLVRLTFQCVSYGLTGSLWFHGAAGGSNGKAAAFSHAETPSEHLRSWMGPNQVIGWNRMSDRYQETAIRDHNTGVMVPK